MHLSQYLMGFYFTLFAIVPFSYAYGPCDEDEAKWCDPHAHQQTVKECLHKKIEQLSPACKNFVKTQEETWSKVLSSWEGVQSLCRNDVQKHCQNLSKESQNMMKAVQVCLMSEAKTLDASCKKELNRHIREFQPNIKELP